jgi:kynureninase
MIVKKGLFPGKFSAEESFAADLDRADPLAGFRKRFHLPKDLTYLDGNSLGLLSREAERSLAGILEEWRARGVRGWIDGPKPWFYIAEMTGAAAAPLVGSRPKELVFTGTTTVNIHALIATFYEPRGRRTRILADELDFPTDIYALRDQIRMKGGDPATDLVLVPSRDGRTVEEDGIIERMTPETALVFLPSVLYRSGQLLDMPRLTREAHRRGIPIGFDCSHSAGVVPHRLSRWGVDFAVFCGYKYLNGGPGCSAFLYLNRRHFGRKPVLTGWFGNRKDRQFDMRLDFEPAASAGGWQISSPGILGSSTMPGALAVINEAGIDRIREKSIRMTSYLIELVGAVLSGTPYDFTIGSPLDPRRRGGHVALEHPREAVRICAALRARGVVPDLRPPNVIRLAPVALYNTYREIWRVVRHLKEIVDLREYRKFSSQRKAVS